METLGNSTGSTPLYFLFFSHSFWTSSSLDVPAGVTQEEGHTGFLIHLLSAVRALIFLARRIQPFLSLVDREVECCVVVVIVFTLKAVPVSTQYFLTSVLVQLTRTPSVVTGLTTQKGYTYQKEIKGSRKVNTHATI